MKLNFTVETHKDKAGNWVAQVVLAGQVIHEQTGPISESQAVSNALTSFTSLLQSALDREDDRLMADLSEGGGPQR
jgi:hypothetical protein